MSDAGPDPLAVALAVARIFDELGVAYVVGGSLASTLHGEARTTADVDLAIQLEPAQAPALARALEAECFVQPGSVTEAAERKCSFHAVHKASMMKLDVYVRAAEGHHAMEIERALALDPQDGGSTRLRVATAEDTILQKLRWFELGGRVSERQWRDVLGVVRAVGPDLDRAYLQAWAPRLGVVELLDRALQEGREG